MKIRNSMENMAKLWWDALSINEMKFLGKKYGFVTHAFYFADFTLVFIYAMEDQNKKQQVIDFYKNNNIYFPIGLWNRLIA